MGIDFNTEDYIGDIEMLEREYHSKNNESVYKVSNWNADPELALKMLEIYNCGSEVKQLDYILPYEIDDGLKREVLDVMCGEAQNTNKEILFTSTGTISIYSLINVLKQNLNRRIAIIAPVYFSVVFACKNLGVKYSVFYLRKGKDGYYIDYKDISDIKKHDIVWITSPVYCTGVYYNNKEIEFFTNLLENGNIVVFDDSISLLGSELIRNFNCYDNSIGICSPHKSICINSVKFSCVIADKRYIESMRHWTDVISGCLSWSNYEAIRHFLSKNYYHQKMIFCKDTGNGFIKLKDICQKYEVDFDENVRGCFMTMYFSDIRYDFLDNFENLRELVMRGGISLIMGSRNYFSSEMGLAIRVNLTNITEMKIQKIVGMINILRHMNFNKR